VALDTTSLVLTVTDTGAGAVNWAVTGAGAGGSVALLRAPWAAAAGGRLAWAEVATATADGAGEAAAAGLSTTPGFYVWAAARMASGTACDRLSGAVFRPVVDAADPIHYRVLQACKTLIQSLNLSGVGGGVHVAVRWFPRYAPGTDSAAEGGIGPGLPMVQIAPWPRETPLGLLTGTDDVGYPVLVAFYGAAEPTQDNDLSRNLKWRRQVAALFRNQRLAGVPEVVVAEWAPDLIVVPEQMGAYLLGSMGFRFRSRESRGLVA